MEETKTTVDEVKEETATSEVDLILQLTTEKEALEQKYSELESTITSDYVSKEEYNKLKQAYIDRFNGKETKEPASGTDEMETPTVSKGFADFLDRMKM